MEKLNINNIKEIEDYTRYNQKVNIIREFQFWKDFKVDDVLIRYSLSQYNIFSQQPDMVSSTCPFPVKYRVVHIDPELGIPWLKQLSVRGGMGKKLICALSETDSKRYRLDPMQIDALILDIPYDPRGQYKSIRTSKNDKKEQV